MTLKEQIQLFNEKNEWLRTYYDEVTSFEFYRDIFPEGSFERKGHYEDNKPNGILLELINNKSQRTTITDDLQALCQSRDNFTITSPVSYYGYQRKAENARYIFALTFDLDGVGMQQLRDVIHQMKNEVIPMATYICNSGNGLHLYYLFNSPIPMYPQNQKYLKAIKYALTKRIWNGFTSTIEPPQIQGIVQGFRVVGTPTKFGKEYPVTAFSVGERWELQDLVSYIPDIDFSGYKEIKALEKNQGLTLEQVKEKYPDWYNRRIVNGEKRGRWNVKPDLYYWWLDRIKREITVGHRYFAIMTLSIYAIKCNISEEQLRTDAYSLLEGYEDKTEEETNHFTQEDIEQALELYNENYTTFPRDDISKLTGLRIDANKRNGRTQEKHLQGARAIRDINNDNWRKGNGRPSAEHIVREWKKNNPQGRKVDCNRATGLDPKTIRKWWN